jgi:hypothetical protein
MMVSFFERRPAQDSCSATLDTVPIRLFHVFDTGNPLSVANENVRFL